MIDERPNGAGTCIAQGQILRVLRAESPPWVSDNTTTAHPRPLPAAKPPEAGCAGHGAVIEGESPLWDLSEVTMSEKQLHESLLRTGSIIGPAARSCEMEARSVPQHRTKVNLQAGLLAWVSGPASVTPNIRSWPGSIGGGSGGTSLCLTPGDLDRSKRCVDRPTDLVGLCGGNDHRPMSFEKSDHLVVVLKPGNAGGAKGMTS